MRGLSRSLGNCLVVCKLGEPTVKMDSDILNIRRQGEGFSAKTNSASRFLPAPEEVFIVLLMATIQLSRQSTNSSS